MTWMRTLGFVNDRLWIRWYSRSLNSVVSPLWSWDRNVIMLNAGTAFSQCWVNARPTFSLRGPCVWRARAGSDPRDCGGGGGDTLIERGRSEVGPVVVWAGLGILVGGERIRRGPDRDPGSPGTETGRYDRDPLPRRVTAVEVTHPIASGTNIDKIELWIWIKMSFKVMYLSKIWQPALILSLQIHNVFQH